MEYSFSLFFADYFAQHFSGNIILEHCENIIFLSLFYLFLMPAVTDHLRTIQQL